MNILITQSVIGAAEIFEGLGHLIFIADEKLNQADLSDIDVVIMRSQVKLTATQVKDTKVKWIGTATAGIDHLPVGELQSLGVNVVNAPGCNANSVADYWLSAMLKTAGKDQHWFTTKTLGLIGYGAVGQAVAKRAKALGFKIIVNDPPREALQLPIPYPTVTLENLLQQSDVVSLHVPMTTGGLWPTKQFINQKILDLLKPNTIFINTARGEVCDSQALVEAKQAGKISDLIIDVWPHEPQIDKALWQAASIATPHIAGHAWLAKWQGTWQLYQALLQYLGQSSHKTREQVLSQAMSINLTNPPQGLAETDVLWHYISQVYDVTLDHQAMQTWFALSAEDQAKAFLQYRLHYPMRSELSVAKVAHANLNAWQQAVLKSAGVNI